MVNKEKRVLVTGGAGFIGSHVVDRLVHEGYAVRVLDDLSSGKLANIQAHLDSGAAEFVKGDIRDQETVKEAVKGVCGVVHLAAQISVSRSVEDPDFTFDVNVAGTENLLAASAEAGVGHFVFASSCAVYGEPQSLPVSEDTAAAPISPYAETKLLGERLCLGFSHQKRLRTVVLRFFNVYGPRQAMNDYSGVITIFLENAKANQPLLIYGDGLQTRDFVYVADVAAAIYSALTCSVDGEVFNIGTGHAASINQLAEAIKALTGSASPVTHEAARVGDIKYSYANTQKATQKLGFTASATLRDGLKTLLNTD